jgi:hypothetical protein
MKTTKTTAKKPLKTAMYGSTVKPTMMKKGGSLKEVPADKVGLSKLPTAVRNKMGYQKAGGAVKTKAKK